MLEIFGTKIDYIEKKKLAEILRDMLLGDRLHQIHTPNAEILLSCRGNLHVREKINQGSLRLCDGSGVQFLQLIFGNEVPERITGNDLVEEVLPIAHSRGLRVWLLGGLDEETNKAAKNNILSKFDNITVDGQHGGPISWGREEGWSLDKNIIHNINNFAPDILFVGIGHPKQDMFIHDFAEFFPSVRVSAGVGGVIDFLAGRAKRAPKIVQKLGLESFWRLLLEPWRIKRVYRAVVVFPMLVIFDKMSNKLYKISNK